jgi:hypothetical protein
VPNFADHIAIPVLGFSLGLGLFFTYQSVIRQPPPAPAANAQDDKPPAVAPKPQTSADFAREFRGISWAQLE